MEAQNQHAYQLRKVPRSIFIKGYELTYKDPPLKNNIYKYRCPKQGCNYSVKIDKENLNKLEENNKDITYVESNTHIHKSGNYISINIGEVMNENQALVLAKQLIKTNINEPLDFHVENLHKNKINFNKSKIRKILYSIREEKYPKDQIFLNYIENITIEFSNEINDKQNFCIIKSQFVNFKKK